MKEFFKKIPIIGTLLKAIYKNLFNRHKTFPGSQNYWIQRYKDGETSGSGSYNKFAEFKAEIINNFVRDNKVTSIIEYGCGDGNQLKLAKYPSYIGFDISPEVITICKDIFHNDQNKHFKLINQYDGEKSQLTLSLDVIYHLVEDQIFIHYMEKLFDTSEQFVIIYSSNTDNNVDVHAQHVKNREFSKWIEENRSQWVLMKHIPNRYPFTGDDRTVSFADFYIYMKPLQ